MSPCFVTRYNVRKLSLIEFGKHFEQSLSGLYSYTYPFLVICQCMLYIHMILPMRYPYDCAHEISIWLCPWEKSPYGSFLAFSLFKEFDKTKSEEVKSEILWHYKLKVVFFFICINDSSTCKPWCHEALVPISSPTPIKYYEFVEYTLVSLW